MTGWGEISEEQVLERNPDYIVTISMYYGEGPTPEEEILSRTGWENVTAVKNGDVFEILVLIRAVGLDAVTFRANGARAKARARTKRRRPVEWRTEDHSAGFVKICFRSDKVHDIWIHSSSSSGSTFMSRSCT